MAVTFVAAGTIAGNSTTNSQSITAPACQAGDILVCVLYNAALSNVISAPDGTWTQLVQQSVTGFRYAAFWKLATGSGGSFVFTKASDDNVLFAGTISAWRGANASSPIDATGVAFSNNSSGADNVTFPTYDPTATDGHILFIAVYDEDATSFGTITPNTNPNCTNRFDQETSGVGRCSIACTSGDSNGAAISARTWASNSTNDARSSGTVFGLVPPAASAIKTVDDLAYASVKTVDDLARASIKTINGLV